MTDVKICDRCGQQFGGWRPLTREYILQRDILKGRTTPSFRHKPVDLCGECDASLQEWYEDGDRRGDDGE